MTPERIAELRECIDMSEFGLDQFDQAEVLDEIERLTADNQRLRDELGDDDFDPVLEAEVDRLEAAIGRLTWGDLRPGFA